MEAHELDIEIRPDGRVSMHVKGAKGEACDAYGKLLEQILNNEGEVERTAEFYEPPTGVRIRIDQRG